MNQNITALNLHYLFTLRDHAVRDLPAACHQFGVSRDFAQKICDTPLDNLKRLADCQALVFQPVVTAQVVDQLISTSDDLRPAFMELYTHAPT